MPLSIAGDTSPFAAAATAAATTAALWNDVFAC
jgi:hypothetical protein